MLLDTVLHEAAARELEKIDVQHRRHTADQAFTEAKSAVALNELYFSVEVETAIVALTHAIAKTMVGLVFNAGKLSSTLSDAGEDVDPKLATLKQAIESGKNFVSFFITKSFLNWTFLRFAWPTGMAS